MPMNQEIKAQWLADLRSGNFVQGHGQLNNDGMLCCLGVLCQQAEAAGIVTKSLGVAGFVYYDDESSILPLEVWQWAGAGDSNPAVHVDGIGYISLAELNDGHKHNDAVCPPMCEASEHDPWTFGQIADIIENQL